MKKVKKGTTQENASRPYFHILNVWSMFGQSNLASNLACLQSCLSPNPSKSLSQLAELFQRDKSVISRHIRNIFKEGELQLESTVAKFATVQKEGNREITRDIEYYNLDVIISVGYRVKSHRGTQFRIWATHRLLIKRGTD